ncbi:pseudouridine-5'-phosphate glycosidase, partial [Klebsiella pneumoniae]|nr:pseudouridine-5'-phosphate glycosidase [Klebsiella pneumoniae]
MKLQRIAPLMRRALSSSPTSASTSWLRVSDEVRAALAASAPVVALESALLTHGLPRPANVSVTR